VESFCFHRPTVVNLLGHFIEGAHIGAAVQHVVIKILLVDKLQEQA
jgi:hypothetical protein